MQCKCIGLVGEAEEDVQKPFVLAVITYSFLCSYLHRQKHKVHSVRSVYIDVSMRNQLQKECELSCLKIPSLAFMCKYVFLFM